MPDAAYCAWKGWTSGGFGSVTPEQQAFFEREILPALAQAGTKPLLLELGFGNGALLSWCRARGMDIRGLEKNPELLACARAAGVPAAEQLAELGLAAGSLHCVVAIDVLEHLRPEDTMQLLQELAPLMRPEGLLIARFPNGDSPFSLPYQNGDMTHLTAIGSRMLRQMAGPSGWRVEAYRAPLPDQASTGFGNALRLRLGLALRRLLERLVARLFLSGQAVVLAPNALAVLRPLPR